VLIVSTTAGLSETIDDATATDVLLISLSTSLDAIGDLDDAFSSNTVRIVALLRDLDMVA
jgi:hypothetical protein